MADSSRSDPARRSGRHARPPLVTARSVSTFAILGLSLAALSGPQAVGISLEPPRETATAGVDIPPDPDPFTVAPVIVGTDGKLSAERPEILADGSAADGESVRSTAAAAVDWQGADAGLPGELKLAHPVASFRLTSLFGWRKNPTGPGSHIHIGQDYAVSCGTPVRASEAGTVTQSAWAGHSGYRVRIDHGSGIETAYSHNSRLVAKVGDKVRQGDLIALAGTTGNSTGCHVHFEVYRDGRWTDPAYFVPRVPGQPVPLSPEERERLRDSINPPRDPATDEPAPLVPAGSTAPKPSETPAPGDKATATPSPSPSKSPEPKPTPKPKPTPTPTESPKPKPEPSGTPVPSPSPKPTPSPSPTPTPTKPAPEPTPTPTEPSPTQSSTPVPTEPAEPSTAPATSPAPSSQPAPEPTPEPEPPSEPTQVSAPASESPSAEPAVESTVAPSTDPAGSLLEPVEELLGG
ncbi:M23 family metallopeptidase [Zhihengliuella salsuginis]|uniref:M23ase beta-sheet core domain-containing protein n=1 Tax=Zhihengliuella salsuginis TaxID=578222 RepID=A0ABQ3GA65_9MICC|nr:M23 family metallopeptidase [Zhihengliuella salsuginis]GHC99452.1 hypothetical protein GCM10008096_01610 [Zhihengliuella salsuginis]